MIVFGLYVNSIEPKAPKPKITPAPGSGSSPQDINRILQEGMKNIKVDVPPAAPEAPPVPPQEEEAEEAPPAEEGNGGEL